MCHWPVFRQEPIRARLRRELPDHESVPRGLNDKRSRVQGFGSLKVLLKEGELALADDLYRGELHLQSTSESAPTFAGVL